ncbi:LTA synthase family protein [Campylobacter troglodytis]|uniref:LTA synthase family protein n=1 Tax=Campylobacter troglodytis TaxID=654363 RepID=UPI00163C40BF|nr:LTA synthase family protein [Campylobacter troglodytis]
MQKTFKIVVLQSLVFMGLLFVLSLVLRSIFIAHFISEIRGVSLAEFAHFALNFLRYDGQIIGVLSVIFFVLNFISKQALIKLYALLVILITAFVGIANIGFYKIYADVFNSTLLGLVFDDKKAILDTALGGDFNFTSKVLIWLLISFAFYAFFALFYAKMNKTQGKKFRIVIFIGFVLCCLFSINGTIGLKGISLSKEIVPVSNAFLRKITHGGFRDLLYVYRSYAKIAKSSFKDFTNEAPLAATRAFFNLENKGESEFDLRKLLQKEVSNPNEIEIRHIFYIIAESLSSWHFDEEFDEIELTKELKALINEKNAFKADIFLQNGTRTIDSLDVQISGLYHTGIPLSLSVGKSPIFEMSPGFIFKDLGFKTSFFYGGSSTWYKIDSYTKSQGFDEIKAGAEIIKFAKEKGFEAPFENSWGAFDHYLFEFIKDYTITNKDTKSFAMIMTTSNHPPYDAPVEKFGVDYAKIKAFIKKHPQIPQKELNEKIFSHIIYQDKMLAHFVREVSKALPNSLFVITGDHKGTSFFHKARGDVPLIIYSPILRPFVLSKIGSHIDISPTIVGLVASNSYKYLSFGEPLLSNDETKEPLLTLNKALPSSKSGKNSSPLPLNADKNALVINKSFYENNGIKNRFALGFNAVANEDFIYDGQTIEYFDKVKIQGSATEFKSQKAKIQVGTEFQNATVQNFKDKELEFEPSKNASLKNEDAKVQNNNIEFKEQGTKDEVLARAMFDQLQRARALSWWIINKGYVIKD